MGALHELWETYREQVNFLVVYIREAHPEEGWVITSNREEDIVVNDPTTSAERLEVAASCAINLQINMPVIVDDIDDGIASAYGALPDRLYLVATDGSIAHQGEPGPWGFDPAALRQAIAENLPG